MKRGLVALLAVGTLAPMAATAHAGPPWRGSPPPHRSRYYGPHSSHGHGHGHGDDGWVAFGLGVLFGAAVEALTEPPPPPPVLVAYPPPPVVYGPPPPEAQAYVAPPPAAMQHAPGSAAPYGGPPPTSWPSALAPSDPRAAVAGGPQGAMPLEAPSELAPLESDSPGPGADAQRVYVPPQTVWREQRFVEPARYRVRLVPVYEDVGVPVFFDVVENGVVKSVLVGTRLERRQVGTREERVVVRPETVRIEHVAETIPGRWAYVPAAAITDLPPPER